MTTRNITHLLVDLDGTLVGNKSIPMSLAFTRLSLREIRRRVPHITGWQALRILIGIGPALRNRDTDETIDMRIVRYFSKKTGLNVTESRSILKQGVFEIFPQIRKYFYPMPGASHFLQWAKHHFDMTLATNPVWPEEIITMRAHWGGINTQEFQYITHIRAMSDCKPSPIYYKEILSARNISAENALLIGNDLKMDLPATKVGIPVFIVGKQRGCRPLPTDGAPAWTGTFDDLKTLLLNGPSPANTIEQMALA
jgi:FMN phosphatase YigB (HAD superfamily)